MLRDVQSFKAEIGYEEVLGRQTWPGDSDSASGHSRGRGGLGVSAEQPWLEGIWNQEVALNPGWGSHFMSLHLIASYAKLRPIPLSTSGGH